MSVREKQQELKRNKKNFISEEEYLEKELLAETKSEYHNGRIVAMAGAKLNHNLIVRNLLVDLDACLEALGCEILPSDMLVHLPECKKYVFPDLTITCEEMALSQKTQRGLQALTNPQVVIEVSSESTKGYDLGEKMKCYLQLKSLKEYVIVSSEEKLVIIYTKNKKGEIRTKIYDENDKEIKIGSCKLIMDRVYRKVGFELNDEDKKTRPLH